MGSRGRPTFLSLLIALIAVGCRDAPPSDRSPAVRALAPDAIGHGTLALPNRATSVKFAVIGDSGRGTPPQHEIAAQMLAFHKTFAYPFVLMVGDNIYEGPATRDDYYKKFEEPYRELLGEGVKFYAVLGNHDDPRQVEYQPFNMKGNRYYSFSPPEDLLAKIATRVEFFGLDSTNLDRAQLRWLDDRLTASRAAWKICFFHHPLYTSGRYRIAARAFRLRLESLLIRQGVDAVFSGHEHIYQRSTLMGGVQYFVTGGAGSLRPTDGVPAPFVARTFASDYHFMLIEIEGRQLHFQAISRSGQTIDAGTLFKDEGDAVEGEEPPVTRQDMPVRR